MTNRLIKNEQKIGKRLWVTVKPRSRREEIREVGPDQYVVSVNAPAREGKANQALIRILAGHFSVLKSCVRIIRGKTGRKKLIELS